MPKRRQEKPSEESVDLAALMPRFANDPLGFTYFAYPWQEAGTRLAVHEGPDLWQARVLHDIGQKLEEGQRVVRVAVASGHGVGKSALAAFLVNWGNSTHPFPQIVVTANTERQLTTKTWRELGIWHGLLLNGDWFGKTATKYFLKEHPDKWFAAAIPWTKEKAEAFAGTHERFVMIILDEASIIPPEIWEVIEGALTGGGRDSRAIIVAFGNPTKLSGRFYECFNGRRDRWMTYRVDSRQSRFSNRELIDEWIKDYGEDSDFVRVRVKGLFPRRGSAQLIGDDLVEAAMRRWGRAEVEVAAETQPVILSLDVARFGDDEAVLLARRGPTARVLKRWKDMDLMQLSAHAAHEAGQIKPTAFFVDANGMGAGVIDRLNQMNVPNVYPVNGALKALRSDRYFNRRTEMWWLAKEWLEQGGTLEPDDRLRTDLVTPEYQFDGKARIQLEPKEALKARGEASPDSGDALAMTFFMPVMAETWDPMAAALEAAREEELSGLSWMAF